MAIKRQIYIIITLFMATALLLVLFAVIPILRDISRQSGQLIFLKKKAAISESQMNGAINFKSQYAEYKPNLDKMDALFVDSANPVDFIEFLENTALLSGAQFQVSPPSLLQDKQFKSVLFRLSLSGDFNSIMRFIRRVELGPYLVQAQGMDIVYAEKKITANVSIKAFSK